MMKRSIIVLAVCMLALVSHQTQASVFSGSGGSSLQNLFNTMGYEHIDVADYQTDLNFKLQGMMEFQLLSRSGAVDLNFGVLEARSQWWGTQYKHTKVFGSSDAIGSSSTFLANRENTSYGFYISKRNPSKWWKKTAYYSFSPFNRSGSVQALFYQDPLNSGSYLLAWSGMYEGSSHADARYDDLVVRMTVHPAPEPATWVLLASGLVGIGVLATIRRKQTELS